MHPESGFAIDRKELVDMPDVVVVFDHRKLNKDAHKCQSLNVNLD